VSDNRKLCPSYQCRSGATLLGIVGADGRVVFAPQRLAIDDEFVAIAREGRAPERRFRFAGACAQGACSQWRTDRCGVIESVLQAAPVEFGEELPQCSIRSECRWYSQEGSKACFVCPLVITETRDGADGAHGEQRLSGKGQGG
jgi:hypothetical protein